MRPSAADAAAASVVGSRRPEARRSEHPLAVDAGTRLAARTAQLSASAGGVRTVADQRVVAVHGMQLAAALSVPAARCGLRVAEVLRVRRVAQHVRPVVEVQGERPVLDELPARAVPAWLRVQVLPEVFEPPRPRSPRSTMQRRMLRCGS